MSSRIYVHTEPSIKTLGPVIFAVDVPIGGSILQHLEAEMAKNLRVDKSRLSFSAMGSTDYLVKVC
jgi:hypothetical protein